MAPSSLRFSLNVLMFSGFEYIVNATPTLFHELQESSTVGVTHGRSETVAPNDRVSLATSTFAEPPAKRARLENHHFAAGASSPDDIVLSWGDAELGFPEGLGQLQKHDEFGSASPWSDPTANGLFRHEPYPTLINNPTQLTYTRFWYYQSDDDHSLTTHPESDLLTSYEEPFGPSSQFDDLYAAVEQPEPAPVHSSHVTSKVLAASDSHQASLINKGFDRNEGQFNNEEASSFDGAPAGNQPACKLVLDKPNTVANDKSRYPTQSRLLARHNQDTESITHPTLLDVEPPSFNVEIHHRCGSAFDRISDDLLESCALPFEEKMKDIYPITRKWPRRKTTEIAFEGLSAVQVMFKPVNSAKIPSHIRLKTSAGGFVTPLRMWRELKFLIKWILLIQKELCHLIIKTKPSYPSVPQRLLKWLFVEVFSPENSLPVCGKIEHQVSIYNQSAFGPPQKWLINFLASTQDAYFTALGLIGIWYKNFEKGIWEARFTHDEEFWLFMNHIMKLGRCPDKGVSLSGNFLDSPIEKFKSILDSPRIYGSLGILFLVDPEALLRASCKEIPLFHKRYEKLCTMSNPLSKESESILANVKDNHTSCFSLKNRGERIIKGLMITATVPVRKDRLQTSYFLRFLENSGGLMSIDRTTKKLVWFLRCLEIYHRILQKILIVEGKEVVENSHEGLMNWLNEQLFFPTGSFPVIGWVEKTFKEFDQSKFGQIQIHIINYFTRKLSTLQLEHSIISLIGYWYKTYHAQFWEINICEDLDYWSLIVKGVEVTNSISRTSHDV